MAHAGESQARPSACPSRAPRASYLLLGGLPGGLRASHLPLQLQGILLAPLCGLGAPGLQLAQLPAFPLVLGLQHLDLGVWGWHCGVAQASVLGSGGTASPASAHTSWEDASLPGGSGQVQLWAGVRDALRASPSATPHTWCFFSGPRTLALRPAPAGCPWVQTGPGRGGPDWKVRALGSGTRSYPLASVCLSVLIWKGRPRTFLTGES